MRAWAAVVAVGWAAASGLAQVEAPAVHVTVDVPAGQVVMFGQPFQLEVRIAGLLPHVAEACAAFDERCLLPAELQGRERTTQSGVGMTETATLRYTARLFASGEVVLPAPQVRLRDSFGTVRLIAGQPTKLNVRSILPDPPGEIEWAGDVRDRPASLAWWWVAAALLLVGGGVAASWRRHVPTPLPSAAAPEPPLHEPVLAELEALQIAADADRAAVTAYYVALAEIVRRYTGRRFAVPALVRTSEELLRSVPGGAELLAPCLQACDLVKFAAVRPTSAEHEAARALAVRFVRSTVTPTAAGSP